MVGSPKHVHVDQKSARRWRISHYFVVMIVAQEGGIASPSLYTRSGICRRNA
jgi:hypothetical protein